MAPKRKVLKKAPAKKRAKSVRKVSGKQPAKSYRLGKKGEKPLKGELQVHVEASRCETGCCLQLIVSREDEEQITVEDVLAFADALPEVVRQRGLPERSPGKINQMPLPLTRH